MVGGDLRGGMTLGHVIEDRGQECVELDEARGRESVVVAQVQPRQPEVDAWSVVNATAGELA